MRKYLCIVVVLCVVLASASGALAWYYDDDPVNHNGDSAETAYLIDSVEALKLMRDRVNDGTEERGKYYRLTKDLDISSDVDWVPIGYKLDENGNLDIDGGRYFTGNFDGGGHTIFVNIDKSVRGSRGYLYSGLFGLAGDYHNTSDTPITSITNLNVRGTLRAHVYYSDGKAFAGGVVLQTQNKTVIENCTFSGDVEAVQDGIGTAAAGGIVAWSRGLEVNNCEVTKNSTISAQLSNATDVDHSYAGGIVGWGNGTVITDCTSHAKINDAVYNGGIAGFFNYRETLANYFDGNRYSGALWGIGDEESDEGCTYTPLSVKILTQTLTPSYATLGQRYEVKLEASEVKGIAWKVISGDLPEGITLGTSGVLSGVAVSEDIYRFEVQVSVPGFADIRDTASYTLAVTTTPPANNSGGGGGGGCSAGFSAAGLVICALFIRRKLR